MIGSRTLTVVISDGVHDGLAVDNGECALHVLAAGHRAVEVHLVAEDGEQDPVSLVQD